MFRTGGGFGFPYKLSKKQTDAARKYSQHMWLGDNWPKAKHSLRWLIEKFWPVPEWEAYKWKERGASDRGVKGNQVKKIVDTQKVRVQKAKNTSKPVKGCVYYTNNTCPESIFKVVQAQLKSVFNGPIVSVSHRPIDLGENIVVDMESSVLSMFRQILIGLETIKADVVYLVEHDVLYHPAHFNFTPPKLDVFYYNQNVWQVNAKDGQPLFYYVKKTSQVCGYRNLFVEHYANRIKRIEEEGFKRSMGFEPGTHKPPRGFDNFESEIFMSRHPNIDIRHRKSLTGIRFKKEQFRDKKSINGWTLADSIPHWTRTWGSTKGRFDQFLKDVLNGIQKGRAGKH